MDSENNPPSQSSVSDDLDLFLDSLESDQSLNESLSVRLGKRKSSTTSILRELSSSSSAINQENIANDSMEILLSDEEINADSNIKILKDISNKPKLNSAMKISNNLINSVGRVIEEVVAAKVVSSSDDIFFGETIGNMDNLDGNVIEEVIAAKVIPGTDYIYEEIDELPDLLSPSKPGRSRTSQDKGNNFT